MAALEPQPTRSWTPSRIVAFGDIHGDLDTLARSMADKGLLRYSDQLQTLLTAIADELDAPFLPALEELVIPQTEPVVVVFLGDLFDRYHHACQVIQFLRKIRWERFGVRLHCLIGNHDLLNFFFFTNPYEVHHLLEGIGHNREEIMRYIGSMGLAESLLSFLELHRDELLDLQTRFYRMGRLEIPTASGDLTLRYPRPLPMLARRTLLPITERPTQGGAQAWKSRPGTLEAFLTAIRQALGLTPEAATTAPGTIHNFGELAYYLVELLGASSARDGQRQWWDISVSEGRRQLGYGHHISSSCVLMWEERPNRLRILPLDWRVISAVWRRHYGAHFQRTKLMHLEGHSLFVHAGLTPLTMLDPMTFGALYQPTFDAFRPLSSFKAIGLPDFVQRANRLATQMLRNTLSDWSFENMSGAEVLDQIGQWRGGAEGLPELGGPLWSDFEYLHYRLNSEGGERLLQLFSAFVQATGIRRVVCGHTYFVDPQRPELRFKKLPILATVGLEYLCIDNGCSRGYRRDAPVPTGIEIGPDDQIRDPGQDLSSFW